MCTYFKSIQFLVSKTQKLTKTWESYTFTLESYTYTFTLHIHLLYSYIWKMCIYKICKIMKIKKYFVQRLHENDVAVKFSDARKTYRSWTPKWPSISFRSCLGPKSHLRTISSILKQIFLVLSFHIISYIQIFRAIRLT